MSRNIISMVRDRSDRRYRYLALRDGADTHYESAEDWYRSYGAHISTEHAGDVTVQAVEYDWLDDDDEEVAAKVREADADISEDEAESLVALARRVCEAADGVESLLAEAVDAYERGDLRAVIGLLDDASSAEREHGDDPATSDLAERLLTETGYVVMHCPEGSAQTYIGSADAMDEALELVARHERGEVADTPKSLWETARASGNRVPGCDYPEPHEDEPEEWAGADDCYAICRIVHE